MIEKRPASSGAARDIRYALALACLLLPQARHAYASKHAAKSPEELRSEYLDRVASDRQDPSANRTAGSLWSPNGPLNDPEIDYKARGLHDNITVLVSVQTTSAQSGSVNSARDFATTSALTGIFGKTPSATNPLLAAQSSSSLKGQGQAASNTAFSTSLTGEVIGVLPNGNLVVEAHRYIYLNDQREDLVIRGVARSGDVDAANTVVSSSLNALEIELKGKGIISDAVRRPNPVTRALLWVFGF